MSTPFVDIENTRTPEQRAIYQKILDEGIDPFDLEHFKKHHPHPIIFENGSWAITQNAFQYSGSSLHLLFLHKDFITSIEQISGEGWMHLQEAIQFAVEHFQLQSGSFFMRFGDTKKTGGSVTHLHAHIIVAGGEPEERKSLYVAIS